MITVAPSFSKSSVFEIFSVHEKPAISNSSGLKIGSISSRCSGNERALLPERRSDTRERRKSSLV